MPFNDMSVTHQMLGMLIQVIKLNISEGDSGSLAILVILPSCAAGNHASRPPIWYQTSNRNPSKTNLKNPIAYMR